MWKNFATSQKIFDALLTDNNIKWCFRAIRCLCFISSEDTILAFNVIKAKAPPLLDDFINYVETYYIGKLKDNSEICREKPMFPVTLWNCYERVIEDLPRSNNTVESWHKQFEVKI